MAKGQASQYWNWQQLAHRFHNVFHRVWEAIRLGFAVGKIRKDQGFLVLQNARVEQLQKHALDGIGRLTDFFDE
jgi:hypothetical protein